MILTPFVRPSAARFRLKTIMAFFAAYAMFMILIGLKDSFLARMVSFSRAGWIMVQVTILVLVIAILIAILLNFFFWRNQIATYPLYLGLVLMIGYIQDRPLFFINPFSHNCGVLFGFCFQSRFWLWLFCRFVLILGLLMAAFVFFRKSKGKTMNPLIGLGVVLSFATILVAVFLALVQLLSPQHRRELLTLTYVLVTMASFILMILTGGYLHQFSLKKEILIYEARVIESGKRSFLTGLHLLIFSEVFLWSSNSMHDWASFIGYLFKLAAFWFLTISMWRARMARSLLHINLTVKSLIQSIAVHETFTSEHSKRVAIFAKMIGKSYGMNRKSLERLVLAGTLHDAGKLLVPKEILQKKEPLSESEWVVLRRHPQEGAKIIAPLKLNWCEQAILQHHERPDGKGYPGRLSGAESIDLFARIIAVADTFDAITSDRHYRFAANFARAQEIIVRESGKQFDPGCVNAFMKAFPELIEFRKNQIKKVTLIEKSR